MALNLTPFGRWTLRENPRSADELYVRCHQVIKQGFIHCLGVMLLTVTTFFVASKVFGLEKSNAEALAGLSYVLAVGGLGYIWKLKNGKTFSLFDRDANKKLIRYAFGAAIVLVGFMLPALIKIIFSVGPWWPLVLLLLIPFGLFAQTANFSILVMAGGWFCKK